MREVGPERTVGRRRCPAHDDDRPSTEIVAAGDKVDISREVASGPAHPERLEQIIAADR